MVIDSPSNPRVKAWSALRSRKERDRTGTFLMEGERECLRAADHLDIATSIVREDRVDVDLPNQVLVTDRVFRKISVRQHPDGVAVVATTPDLGLERFTVPPSGVVLVADGIEKPGNVGAMIRTADGFGAALVGSSLGTDIVNPNVVRAAQGSLFSTPLAVADRSAAVAWALEHTSVVVADPSGASTLWDSTLTGPVSLVIGSEHAGVDVAWLDVGDRVSIPIQGAADSFNASVAAALFVAEAIRQRR